MDNLKLEDRRPKMEEGVTFNFRLRCSNLRLFIPSLIWLITIAILSGYPGNKIPDVPFINFDKLVHVGIYMILSVIICFAYIPSSKKPINVKIVIVCFGIFYGGFMEFLQEYIFINRSGNWYDFFANAIGAILGVVLFPFVVKLLPFKR